MKIAVCGSEGWNETLRESIEALTGWVDFAFTTSAPELGALLATSAMQQLDIVVVNASADVRTAAAVISELRNTRPRVVVVGIGFPNQYAQLRNVDCHMVVVNNDLAHVAALVQFYWLGRQSIPD